MLDARQLPEGNVLEADVCIVGAGAAGISIARALVGTSLSVLVLESGGLEADPATQALYEGEVVGEPLYGANVEPRELVETRLRYFGGSTNHWAGTCRPLEAIDFEERPWMARSGWPFGLDELQRWYEQAQRVCRLGPERWDWRWWSEQEGLGPPLLDSGRVATNIVQIAFPAAFGRLYGDELDAAPNVEICTWANVVELLTGPGGDHVTEAAVATLDGNRLRAVAERFVLAVGGIENPRLLLASDGAHPAGLGNEHDLVGRYFNEHLQVAAGFASIAGGADDLTLHRGITLPVGPDDGDVGIRAPLGLTAEAQRADEIMGVQFQPILAAEGSEDAPHQPEGVAAGDVADLLAAQLDAAPGDIAHVQVLAEQEPNSESRVVLGPQTDPLGMRRVAVDWRHTELDRRSIVRGLEILAEELGQAGVGRLQALPGGVRFTERESVGVLDLYEVDPALSDDRFPFGIAYHHMGTTRMHPDPAEGVVDADCRVHGVDNLYLAGSSVFPTGGSATPTYTLVALALRLADHLTGGTDQ